MATNYTGHTKAYQTDCTPRNAAASSARTSTPASSPRTTTSATSATPEDTYKPTVLTNRPKGRNQRRGPDPFASNEIGEREPSNLLTPNQDGELKIQTGKPRN